MSGVFFSLYIYMPAVVTKFSNTKFSKSQNPQKYIYKLIRSSPCHITSFIFLPRLLPHCAPNWPAWFSLQALGMHALASVFCSCFSVCMKFSLSHLHSLQVFVRNHLLNKTYLTTLLNIATWPPLTPSIWVPLSCCIFSNAL